MLAETLQRLTHGLLDDNLLVNKNNREVLEPLSDRIEQVRTFLKIYKPTLEYEIVPIQDVFGPTAWDANIQALVVSKETQSGAETSEQPRHRCMTYS